MSERGTASCLAVGHRYTSGCGEHWRTRHRSAVIEEIRVREVRAVVSIGTDPQGGFSLGRTG